MKATVVSLFDLGRQARLRRHGKVWLRADGSVVLLPSTPDWGKLDVKVSEVHLHPKKGESLSQVLEQLAELRVRYPQAHFHGFSPGWLQRQGLSVIEDLKAAGLDSFCWFTGELEGQPTAAASGWEQCADLPIAKVASLVYGPEVGAEALQARVQALASAEQIVPLPRAVGDLVVIPGATTDGTRDIEVLSRCRAVAPPEQRVRASWGALGFKLAQSSLAFGADALGGWGLEEQLAYSGRMRPADLIGWDEARAGALEAGMEPL